MKKIVFMGTPEFSVPIFEQLVESEYEIVLAVTQPDRLVGRKRELTPPPVKRTALYYEIPIFQPEKIKENYEEILSYEPDLIVTAAYGQILPKELLETPLFGCINVHASLLPKLRGGAPIHYALLRGEKETGITIMYMDEGLDTGDILSQEKLIISKEDDVGSLHDQLSGMGANLLLKTLPKIFNREITPIQQNEEEATYAPNITREVERIDWTKTNIDVFNHIRGLRPWPVAYTTYKGDLLKIWRGEPVDQVYDGKPGEIVAVAGDSFIVVCGNQKGLRITDIQPAGRRQMPVADYLHGAKDRLQKGILLGD